MRNKLMLSNSTLEMPMFFIDNTMLSIGAFKISGGAKSEKWELNAAEEKRR